MAAQWFSSFTRSGIATFWTSILGCPSYQVVVWLWLMNSQLGWFAGIGCKSLRLIKPCWFNWGATHVTCRWHSSPLSVTKSADKTTGSPGRKKRAQSLRVLCFSVKSWKCLKSNFLQEWGIAVYVYQKWPLMGNDENPLGTPVLKTPKNGPLGGPQKCWKGFWVPDKHLKDPKRLENDCNSAIIAYIEKYHAILPCWGILCHHSQPEKGKAIGGFNTSGTSWAGPCFNSWSLDPW